MRRMLVVKSLKGFFVTYTLIFLHFPSCLAYDKEVNKTVIIKIPRNVDTLTIHILNLNSL